MISVFKKLPIGYVLVCYLVRGHYMRVDKPAYSRAHEADLAEPIARGARWIATIWYLK